MSKKIKKIILAVMVSLLILGLFCVKLTGSKVHMVLGVLLIIVSIRHTIINYSRVKHTPKTMRTIDIGLIIALVLMLASGFFIHMFPGYIVLIILHKMSALMFCIGIIAHVLQHRQKRKENGNVS